MSSTIQQKSIQEITESINTATQQTLDIPIGEAKQLRSGDIAIQAGSEIDAANLRGSVDWLADLGSKAKVVRQAFGITAFSVRTDEVNMEDKEGIIARIQAKNGSVPSLKKLDICWVGWLRKPQEHQHTAHLVIESTNAYQTNAAFDGGLLIGSELKICRVYNRACLIQQCFNCQNYAHSTPQCVKPPACCYCAGAHTSKECKGKSAAKCAGAHTSKECKGKSAAKCAGCGGNHEAYDRKCHERKKEIGRITAARLSTSDQYPIIPSSTPPPDILYFSSGATIPLSTKRKNAAKKKHPKPIQNKDALQSSSAPTNQNTIPTTSEPRPGVNTRSQAGSKRHSSNSVIKCDISDVDHHSDHLPIETPFQISLAASISDAPRKSWKKINPDTFFKAVIKCIQDSPSISPPPSANFDYFTEDLDSQIQSLASGLSKALNKSAPDLKICARSKAGFNVECKEAQMRARRLKKAWKACPCEQTWEEFWAARNCKGTLIDKALCLAYRTNVAEACGDSLAGIEIK